MPSLDGLGLTPFPLPDFVRDAKQVVHDPRGDKQTTIVISERDITGFDQEIAETGGAQCRQITRIEPLRAGRTRPIAENGEANLPQLWRVAMRTPNYDSGQAAVFSLERS